MTTRIISCTPTWDSSDLKEATSAVKSGQLIVIPTDTVYGIGCDASNPDAVARVLAAKGRGRQMPPPVVVPGRESIETLCVDIPEVAYRLADEYWPGGLTLILRARPDLGWDLGETGGTIGVRMPNEPRIRTLLDTVGPLALTSANTTGNPPATSVDEAVDYFGTQVLLYVDGSPTPGSTPSTILDFTKGGVRAIRLGTLSLEQLSLTAGTTIEPANTSK